MRNFIVLAIAVVLSVSPAMAENQKSAGTVKAAEVVTGTVDSIGRISPSQGADEGSLELIDAAGNTLFLTINENTKMLDEAANQIDSDDIVDGNQVTVTYSKTDLGNVALSISKVGKKAK